MTGGGFIAGSIVGKLLLDKTGWDQSIRAVTQDQEKLKETFGKTGIPLENLNRLLKEYGIKTAADAAARTKQLTTDLESLNIAYKSGQISLGAYQEASKKIDTELKKLVVDAGATKETIAGPSGLTASWQKLTAAYLAGMAAFSAVNSALSKLKDFMGDCVKGAIEQEQAEKKVELALATTGRTITGNLKHYVDYSSALQKTTLFTDEQVLASQALLLQLTNLNQKGIDKATEGAIGLASVMGIDLHSATMLVAKAMEGNYGALSRYGIKVNELLPLEQKNAQLLEQLAGFYKRATGETETFGGSITQLKKAYDELKEAIGKAITNSGDFKTMLGLLKLVIDDVTRSISGQQGTFGIWSLAIKAVTDQLKMRFGPVLLTLAAEGAKHERSIRDATKAYEDLKPTLKIVDEWLLKHGIDIATSTGLWDRSKGVIKETGDQIETVTGKIKAWNEVLGVTTRLDLEKKIALMESALLKYRDAMPISEQARLKDEIQKAKDELSGFNITAQVTLGLLPSLREKTANLVATFDSWLSLLPNLRKETGDLFITWEDSASKMEFVNEEISTSWDNTVNEIRGVWQAGLLEMLRGTKTFGDLIQNMFSTIGSAVSESIFKAFTKAGSKLAESLGAFAGPIGAALGAVAGSLISLIGGLFEKKPKKTEAERMAEEITQMAKEEIATLAVYGKVSEDTAKKIAEARQSGMAGYAAISKYFADIIRDTGVTGENINKLWAGVGEIIDRIKSGALSAADGIKSLGDSFTAMLEGAKKLGQEGGQAMVDFILKLRNSGIEVAEVTQYVLEQLGKIPSALATLVSNIYMPTTPIKALQKELDKLTEKLKGVKEGTDEWKTITTRIGEINKEIGITNKHIPQTAKELGAMGQIATASFQAMLANGMNFLDALNAMKEPLQGLLARYKALGIAIPAFLKPLLRMEWLAEKFPVAFQNMGAALDVLNSLRNAAYLTQGTFDALASSIATSAKSILGITGSLNSFMKVAHLSQTEIQLLLPIVSQFVGAAAIFGLGIPAWMKTFVTKQLGVDWEKFKEAAKLQANAGIATVEELKKRMIQAKNLQAELKVADWKLMRDLRESLREKLDRVIDAIKGVPGAQSGCYFTKPALVHVAEHGPEAILNRQQLSNLIGGGAGRNLNLTFNINAIDNEGMKTVVHKKVIPMIIDAINNNTGHLGTRLKTAQGIA